MALGDLLIQAAAEYPAYRLGGRVKASPTHRLITQRLPQELREMVGDRRRYLCQGSTGAGNVTPAPWLAVLDPTVTDSPQRGYYVAYLFALDLTRVSCRRKERLRKPIIIVSATRNFPHELSKMTNCAEYAWSAQGGNRLSSSLDSFAAYIGKRARESLRQAISPLTDCERRFLIIITSIYEL